MRRDRIREIVSLVSLVVSIALAAVSFSFSPIAAIFGVVAGAGLALGVVGGRREPDDDGRFDSPGDNG